MSIQIEILIISLLVSVISFFVVRLINSLEQNTKALMLANERIVKVLEHLEKNAEDHEARLRSLEGRKTVYRVHGVA